MADEKLIEIAGAISDAHSSNPINVALADLEVAAKLGHKAEAETRERLERLGGLDGLVGLYFLVDRKLREVVRLDGRSLWRRRIYRTTRIGGSI